MKRERECLGSCPGSATDLCITVGKPSPQFGPEVSVPVKSRFGSVHA